MLEECEINVKFKMSLSDPKYTNPTSVNSRKITYLTINDYFNCQLILLIICYKLNSESLKMDM